MSRIVNNDVRTESRLILMDVFLVSVLDYNVGV